MMNWETLVDIAQKLDVPQKHIREPVIQSQWYLMRDKNDTFSITLAYPKFEIVKYDLIKMPDGDTYEINEIYLLDEALYSTDDEEAICNDCMICLENINTGGFQDMKARDFFYALDCENTYYVESNWLDYVNR